MGDEEMIKVLMTLLTLMLLSSCTTLKKTFCDCVQGSKEVKSAPADHTKVIEKNQNAAAGKDSGIVVDSSELELGNRMTKAVDVFVFKNQREDFTALCKDERFDCFVNDKKFPSGRKKIKRKVPPFLSGSKMGLQGENRIRVRYNFYP